MENDVQIQKAGDHAQQIQARNIYIANGISEERVRAICTEVAVRAIADNTQEANEKAMQRIERFVDLLLPRVQKIEKEFDSFSDPAFQVLLRKAELTAACTEREYDYNLLSELLGHRIKNKTDIKKKASILRAAEIIDQIDDDSLCALTMYHAIISFVPLSGNITQGIQCLSELYEKIGPDNLPKDDMWMDNLSILGAITTVPFSAVRKYEEIFGKVLDGYICVGIEKDSENYSKAIQLLGYHNINTSILVDHELLDGYVRISVNQKTAIEELTFGRIVNINGENRIEKQTLTAEQKKCLYEVLDLYSHDSGKENEVKNNLQILLKSFESMRKTVEWWNGLNTNFRATSIGQVIAHANAKSIDDSLPNID